MIDREKMIKGLNSDDRAMVAANLTMKSSRAYMDIFFRPVPSGRSHVVHAIFCDLAITIPTREWPCKENQFKGMLENMVICALFEWRTRTLPDELKREICKAPPDKWPVLRGFYTTHVESFQEKILIDIDQAFDQVFLTTR